MSADGNIEEVLRAWESASLADVSEAARIELKLPVRSLYDEPIYPMDEDVDGATNDVG